LSVISLLHVRLSRVIKIILTNVCPRIMLALFVSYYSTYILKWKEVVDKDMNDLHIKLSDAMDCNE